MAASMRLRSVRWLGGDGLALDFETDDGQARSAEIVFDDTGAITVWRAAAGGAFAHDYTTVPSRGWPAELDMRTFADLLFAFRAVASADWPVDDALAAESERRQEELERRWRGR